MTSFAFILGVLPLAIATGAGSGGQNAIGTGVIGGMLCATVLAVFYVPMFFVAVLHWFRVGHQSAVTDDAHPAGVPLQQGGS
jgi:multidrug efflux pump